MSRRSSASCFDGLSNAIDEQTSDAEPGMPHFCNKTVIVPEDPRDYLTLRTVAGDTFTISKPYVTEDLFAQIRELAPEIFDENSGSTN